MARRAQVSQIHDRTAHDLPINSRVAIDIVVDPFSAYGEKIKVIRSVRNDPLFALKARGFIGEHEYSAGRMWQSYYEAAQIGSVRAIDPGKEAVDGGRLPEPITDHQIRAIRELSIADKGLGHEGLAIIREVLGEAITIKQVAARRGMTSKREELYFGARLRECLNTLAKIWGLTTERLEQNLT